MLSILSQSNYVHHKPCVVLIDQGKEHVPTYVSLEAFDCDA